MDLAIVSNIFPLLDDNEQPLKLQFLDKTLAQKILPVIPFIRKIHFPFSYMKFMRILQTFYLSTTIHLKFNFHCLRNVLETVCLTEICSTERNLNCNIRTGKNSSSSEQNIFSGKINAISI